MSQNRYLKFGVVLYLSVPHAKMTPGQFTILKSLQYYTGALDQCTNWTNIIGSGTVWVNSIAVLSSL